MGANNNNNNCYGNNNEDTHFNDLQQVVSFDDEENDNDGCLRHDGGLEAAALRRRRTATTTAVGKDQQPPTDMVKSEAIKQDKLDDSRLQDDQRAGTRINRLNIHKNNHICSHSHSHSPNYHHHHHHHHQSKACSLFVTIMLPFVLVFLLPSQNYQQDHHHHPRTSSNLFDSRQATNSLDQLLISLLRLPLDRFRLSSGYSMMLLANAKEIQQPAAVRQVSDLQEEETHMLLMAPEQQQAQRGGYQLAPMRQAGPQGYGAAAVETDTPYGSEYAATSGGNHASLMQGGEPSGVTGAGAGASEDQVAAAEVMPASASGSVLAPSGGSSAAAQRTDLPSVRALNVKCEKNHMTVNIVFDRPFYGMVFSKGHYNDQKCVHLPPNSGQTSINFDIHLGKCGMSSSSDSSTISAAANGQQQALQAAGVAGGQQQQPNGLFIENTIIIQYDPQVQEIYDQARRLRCTWYDYYEKSVTFRPYNVDMLDAVTANFLGDNIQCWMQIQVGKGPWSSEVAGIVKIGQTMTMVLAIKDDENKFDMLVRNCVASDGKHQPIQLVDEYGCVARPKIMAKFQKVKNFGPAASIVSYAHFQAFKFPDSMSVHFQCVIQVCRYDCPEPVCGGGGGSSAEGGGGGGGSPAAVAGPQQDYAVSGTELVSLKEPLPVGLTRAGQNLSHLLQQQQHQQQQHQQQGSGSNSINLKLDDSQGRVQVKLDTSMMAGANSNGLRASGGALPPHLLLSSSEAAPADQTSSNGRGHTHLSSSYYKPSLGSATAPAPQLSSAPASAGMSRPLASSASQMRQSQPTASLSGGGQHQQQYSSLSSSASLLPPPPHHHHHQHHPRPAYMMTNRMGELVAEDSLPRAQVSSAMESDDSLKLSLIASPRALPYGMATTPVVVSSSPSTSTSNNHRYRRSINTTSDSPKSKRQAAVPDSTAIKTQRTIQVVSPDDVAFNLVDLDGGSGLSQSAAGGWQQETGEWNGQQRRRMKQYQTASMDSASLVCFSAGRLITSALASVALLATLVLAAALIIMRQRKRLSEKLSPVYDSSSSPDLMIGNQSPPITQYQQQQQQQEQQQQRQQRQRELAILRRQQEEMQQRNTYLGRLYSQFVPATYWR